MRDRAGIEPGRFQPFGDIFGRRPFLAMGERAGKGGSGPRAAESEELALRSLARRLAHRLDIGRADAPDDRDEAIGDPGLLGGGLDIGGARLLASMYA